MAKFHKEGLIIDERFNSGGQIPDRFIELLNRPALAFWVARDGKDWQSPPVSHFGPKVMLINGWSESGGDVFPTYLRKAGLGPLIGTRTHRGLTGTTGVPALIDGGIVSVPAFQMYDPDGEWVQGRPQSRLRHRGPGDLSASWPGVRILSSNAPLRRR